MAHKGLVQQTIGLGFICMGHNVLVTTVVFGNQRLASLMDWFVVNVSREVQNLKKRRIRIKDLIIFFPANPSLCKWS